LNFLSISSAMASTSFSESDSVGGVAPSTGSFPGGSLLVPGGESLSAISLGNSVGAMLMDINGMREAYWE